MSQEPPSSQLSFHSAAEEFEQDIDLSDAPFEVDDDEDPIVLDLGPQAFENPAEGSQWNTHEDPMFSASYHDIVRQINEFTGPRGYAVGVSSLKRPKDDLTRPFRKAYIVCDRKCKKNKGFDEFARVRETTSRNWNCEWAGVIYRTSETTWTFYIHTPNGVSKNTHNYPPLTSAASYSRLRREALAPLLRTFVDIPTRQGNITPGEILRSINDHDYDVPVLRKDINNRRAKLAKRALNGRSPMQALLFELQESEQFRYFYACDAQNQVT
jgi:hypothetical protein